MLVGATLIPSAPLLVPGVGGRTDVLADVRAESIASLRDMLAVARPEHLVVVGGGAATRRHDRGAVGSLGGLGIDLLVALGDGSAPDEAPAEAMLPLSVTVGAFVLAAATGGEAVDVSAAEVDLGADTRACELMGATLADSAGRVAFLVVGDGSAATSEQSPGYLREGASDLDDLVSGALRDGRVEEVLTITPASGADALMAGRASLQVLAGATRGHRLRTTRWSRFGDLGVTYWVGSWVAESPVRAGPSRVNAPGRNGPAEAGASKN